MREMMFSNEYPDLLKANWEESSETLESLQSALIDGKIDYLTYLQAQPEKYALFLSSLELTGVEPTAHRAEEWDIHYEVELQSTYQF